MRFIERLALEKLDEVIKKKQGPGECSVVIVAAGSSQRMGSDKIRQELGGMPVIARTLLSFEKSAFIDEIILVVRRDIIGEMAELCSKYAITKCSKVLAGGSSRMESALIGACETGKRTDIILVHDGARPLVSDELIKNVVEGARKYNAVVPALKSVDTLKSVDDGSVVLETLDREHVVRVQTPQGFSADILKGALTHAVSSGGTFTDDASAVEALGFKVHCVPGDESNIKLTVPGDYERAEGILKARGDYVENRSWL